MKTLTSQVGCNHSYDVCEVLTIRLKTRLPRVILFLISQETPGKIITYSGLPFSTGKMTPFGASQVALMVKNPPANAGDVRDAGLIPGSGRSPGEGNGNPLQYSCLENPMDRGAW